LSVFFIYPEAPQQAHRCQVSHEMVAGPTAPPSAPVPLFQRSYCAAEKTPGHQKAARRGGEKDEGIFQWIGLSGALTWSAEYPFTGRTIATEPYGKMTPRLPDGN